MVIGLGGYAKVGKDTLFKLFQEFGTRKYERFSMADALKAEIKPELMALYNIDIFDCTPEEKEFVRPRMVERARERREENPTYWVEKTAAKIRMRQVLRDCVVPVITDVRYQNEVDYLKNYFRGSAVRFVAISRDNHGPANEEEATYTTPLYNSSEIIPFSWGNVDQYATEDLEELVKFMEGQIFQ